MTAKFMLGEKFTKKKLTENIGLKIASLIVAIVLWFIVVNVTDPAVTQTYRNVPVKIINANVITDNGKTLEVIDDSQVISSVTIKASRTTVQELGSSVDSIIATADMNNLSSDGFSVPIEIATSKYADKIDSIRASSTNLYVNIENKRTIQLPLTATTSGEIESGYILGNVFAGQNQVRISGPESVIERVKSASVDVQVTGFTGNIVTQSDIMLFDAEGEIIPEDNLTLNVNTVEVSVELLATKRVPIYYAASGMPAEGYALTGESSCDPETVVIAGPTASIASISEVSIPSEALNITGQTENMLTVVDLTNYLPAGVRLADSSATGKASITIYIEPFVEGDYTVYTKNISIENVPEGFEAAIEEDVDDIEFILVGLAQDIEKLQTTSLNYRVDFEDYALLNNPTEFTKGVYECYLVMDLPEGLRVKEPVAVHVRLNEKDE